MVHGNPVADSSAARRPCGASGTKDEDALTGEGGDAAAAAACTEAGGLGVIGVGRGCDDDGSGGALRGVLQNGTIRLGGGTGGPRNASSS